MRLFFATDTFILRVSINLCLYENVIPSSRGTVPEHPLKIRSVIVGARHCPVDVCIEYDNIISLRIFPTNAELTFY